MWALVERGVVRELRGTDPEGHYHPDVPWVVGAPDGCAVGWTYKDGQFAPPAPAPMVVPQEVSAFQLRAALLAQPGRAVGNTLLTDWSAAVTASSDPALTVAWEYAVTWGRTGTLVATVSHDLGLTAAQVDALFVAASKLRA